MMIEETPEQQEAKRIFEDSMKKALAHLDEVTKGVHEEKEKAIDEKIAAQEELKRIRREAEQLAQVHYDETYKVLVADLRKRIWGEVIRKLILSGLPSLKLKKALDLSPEVLADAWMEIGFDAMGEKHIGHVGYQNEGRSGKVIFYREDVVLSFYYEFGGNHVLAYIMVPTIDQWEEQTGIPLAERMEVLEFIARRVIRDQAAGHAYRITQDAIYFEKIESTESS